MQRDGGGTQTLLREGDARSVARGHTPARNHHVAQPHCPLADGARDRGWVVDRRGSCSLVADAARR